MKQIIVLMSVLVLALSGISQATPKGLQKGESAPLFTSTDQDGNTVSLQTILQKGPAVLVFYRGQWCPYCNKQLAQLQDSVSFITAKGATLIAISPETGDNVKKTIQKTGAAYPVLSDKGMTIMNEYRVTYSVDTAVVSKYKSYGIDFNVVNGSNGEHLPVPAVFIVDPNGTIRFVHFDPDYSKRASVKEILSYL